MLRGSACLIDWQSPAAHIGAADLVTMCATFWTPAQRAEGGREQGVLRNGYSLYFAFFIQYRHQQVIVNSRAEFGVRKRNYATNGFFIRNDLIDLLFVCGIVGVLCSVALPSLFRARLTAGAASAIGSMRRAGWSSRPSWTI